jgi:hypothetical protein
MCFIGYDRINDENDATENLSRGQLNEGKEKQFTVQWSGLDLRALLIEGLTTLYSLFCTT